MKDNCLNEAVRLLLYSVYFSCVSFSMCIDLESVDLLLEQCNISWKERRIYSYVHNRIRVGKRIGTSRNRTNKVACVIQQIKDEVGQH